MKPKKKVKHLCEGDILSATGAVVVHEAQPSKWNKPYWYLTIQYPGQDPKQVYWRPDTIVSVEEQELPII